MKTRKPGAAADVDNRSRLLHAACDVFAEFGYEGASLARLPTTPASRSSSSPTTSARRKSCGSLPSTTCSSAISRPARVWGSRRRETARAVPQSLATATDRHAAAAAAAQDLRAGVPREQCALPQHHRAETPAPVHDARFAVLPRGRAPGNRRAFYSGGDLLPLVRHLQSQPSVAGFRRIHARAAAQLSQSHRAAGGSRVRNSHGEARCAGFCRGAAGCAGACRARGAARSRCRRLRMEGQQRGRAGGLEDETARDGKSAFEAAHRQSLAREAAAARAARGATASSGERREK